MLNFSYEWRQEKATLSLINPNLWCGLTVSLNKNASAFLFNIVSITGST